MNVAALSPRDIAILDLESRLPVHSARKEEEIAADLSLSAVRYYQLLGRLLDSPAALAYDPLLVRRLRRLRDAERARRASQPRVAIAWCRSGASCTWLSDTPGSIVGCPPTLSSATASTTCLANATGWARIAQRTRACAPG